MSHGQTATTVDLPRQATPGFHLPGHERLRAQSLPDPLPLEVETMIPSIFPWQRSTLEGRGTTQRKDGTCLHWVPTAPLQKSV